MNLANNMWFFLAVGAAICWGLGYTFAERVFKEGMNPYLYLSIITASQIIAYPLFFYFTGGDAKSQLEILKNPYVIGCLVAAMAAFVLGNAFVFSSIQLKNASLASIIEIAYPFLVVLFTWLFFKDVQVNLYTILGGILVFSGVALVFVKS